MKSILLPLSLDNSIFYLKTNQQNEFKFLKIIAIYILHYHDFSRKNWPFSWEL